MPASRASESKLSTALSWERSKNDAKSTYMEASAAYNIEDFGVERFTHVIAIVPNQRGGAGGSVDVTSHASGTVFEATNSLVSLITVDEASTASTETSSACV